MRSPWWLVAIVGGGLLIGFGIGVVYAWVISPVAYVDSAPSALRSDFKDQFRMAIAAAYASDGNLPRARVRLALLADSNPAQALLDQSRRAGALGGPSGSALALSSLAQALGTPAYNQPSDTPTRPPTGTATQPTASPPPASGTPLTSTPSARRKPSLTPVNTITPRPSPSPSPTPGSPFAIVTNEPVCDETLPTGLLQVIVKDADGKQVPGQEIIIAWQGGQESFFTGLTPELGDGYADFVMQGGVVYSLRLSVDSETASNLSIPLCHKKDGSSYGGGLQLVFQQP